ncbi:MAG: ABC transporter ATP-binding protein, partial [bacterium]|nr:ABC transporter ATP-binding protein [bacterium]
MTTAAQENDLQIIQRYTGQPAGLPRELRQRIEQLWQGQPIQLYALADLDGSMQLCRTWVALGPEHVALVKQPEGTTDPEIHSFARSGITAVREAPGLSCSVLNILGEPGEPGLATLRYTHRQRRAMENIRFVLEEQLEGRAVPTGDGDREYIDGLARPIRDAQALVASRELAVLWRLLSYLRPYRRQVALGMSAAALITVFSLIPPYLAGYLIDEVISPVQDGLLPRSQGARVAWLAVGTIALTYLMRQLCAFVRLRYMSTLGEWVARDLRTDLYDHLHTLSLSFFSRKKTGSLITRVSSDTDRLWEFLAFGIVDVSLSLVMLLGLGIVLIHLDWQLGLVMTLPVPILCWAIYLYGERLNQLFLRAWRKWSSVTDVLSDTIPGMRVVKAFNQEEREKGRFGHRNYDVTDEFNRIHRLWTKFWPALMLAIHFMALGVWIFALPRLLGGVDGSPPTLSSGTFVSFLLYTTMFVAPIEIIGQMARITNRATSSAHRVFEVLDTQPEVVDASQPVRLEPIRGHVSFEKVSFGYDGLRQVIRGISFEVKEGEMVGLVGPSGGGKSTVASLIARFYDVTGGTVRIDGVDVRELDSGHFRQQLGMVLQDPYLFHGSVLENIRYGAADATTEEVVRAGRAANAHDFICKLEHGYDTIAGERGHTLSGGERQRVSIARAILSDPRILILDEATSSVDTETERNIQEALDRLTAGRTVIAIAHRLSTLRRADRLFVIEKGRISERGTHQELLADPSSTYKRLHD